MKIFLPIIFYIENSSLFNKEKGNLFIILSTLFSLYLIIQSSIKLTINHFDFFNFIYLIIGSILFLYNIKKCFYPAYIKHKNLKTLFGYKSIAHYYEKI